MMARRDLEWRRRDLEWQRTVHRHSRYHVCHHSRSLGTNFKTKIFKFIRFIDPSDQNERHFTPFLCKIWSIEDNIALWDYPFKAQVSGLPEYYYFLIRS